MLACIVNATRYRLHWQFTFYLMSAVASSFWARATFVVRFVNCQLWAYHVAHCRFNGPDLLRSTFQPFRKGDIPKQVMNFFVLFQFLTDFQAAAKHWAAATDEEYKSFANVRMGNGMPWRRPESFKPIELLKAQNGPKGAGNLSEV